MLTDEERREVARRLRDCHGGWSSGDCYYTIIGVLCLPDTSRDDGGHALYDVIAGLIEPEPERTCVIDFTDEDGFYLSCGHIVEGCIRPSYCSSCGAKVVDE